MLLGFCWELTNTPSHSKSSVDLFSAGGEVSPPDCGQCPPLFWQIIPVIPAEIP